MSISNCEVEQIAHIYVEDKDFTLYLSMCYNTMTLHAYKYNNECINYEWFNHLSDFVNWVHLPILYNN